MRAEPFEPSSVGSSRCVPLVGGEIQVNRVVVGAGEDRRNPDQARPPVKAPGSGRRSRAVAWTGRDCRDDACHQHADEDHDWRHRSRFPVGTRLEGDCSADRGRIPGSPGHRHTPDLSFFPLPRDSLACTMSLFPHKTSTISPDHPGPWLDRRILGIRRSRGVVFVAFRFRSQKVVSGSQTSSFRETSRPVARDAAGYERRLELPWFPSRICCGTSCNRGMHDRPMKKKVVRRVSEGKRSRPILLSGKSVPEPTALHCEGVGRTRP